MQYFNFRGRKLNSFKLIMAVAVIAALSTGACHAYTAGDPEFRALYVDAWHAGARNVSEVNQLINDVKYCNANAIVLQVRRRGDTIYPSSEPLASGFSASYDALADLIQKCHSSSPRIEVHAWFVINAIASTGSVPTNPNHPYKKYPQYLTKTSSGDQQISGDYWFDQGHPGAEQYTYNVIMDVVNRYNVDGINLDYIRFGSIDSGFNDVSVARFNSFYSRYGGDFNKWRRDQITNLVRKIYVNAIAAKPNIKISADCVAGAPAPASSSNYTNTQAYSKYFQDWQAWMQEGILDISMPMAYFDCDGGYGHLFDPWVCFTSANAYNRQSVMAPGIYSPACLIAQLSSTRNLPCGSTNGAGIYAYASMSAAMKDAAKAVWSSKVSVPAMPWKSSPTKGYIRGNVTFAQSVWVDGATISITGPVNRTMFADGTGFFAFIDVPPGTYTVNCNSSYGVRTQNVQVTAGQVASANIDYPLSSLVISNIDVTGETGTKATITWTTNAGASSKVFYGTDRTCSQSTTEDNNMVTSHSVTLDSLSPNTLYFFKVYSKNPQADAAISSVCALITKPVPDAHIVESRQGGKNYTDFTYSGVATSTMKSTVAGVTAGIGCYYAGHLTPPKWGEWSFTPTISGSYNVFGTWGTNAYAAETTVPTWTVTNAGATISQNISQASGANTWQPLTSGPVQLNKGVKYTVRLTTNPDNVGNKRTYWDSVKWEFASESVPPSTPNGLMASDIQENSVTLEWTPSTDNVGVAGYRILRGSTSANMTVIDVSPTNSYVDTDVLANTKYWYAVSAYDSSGNKSGNSSTISPWTMCRTPNVNTIVCDKQAGVWHPSGPFTFTAVEGFGPGKVNYYKYVFTTDPSHEWTGTETAWVSGVRSISVASSAEPYYLHIRGYNQGAVPGEPTTLGPYYLDTTAPQTPVVTPVGAATVTSLTATWSADDPESGVQEYEYAVGTTSGAANVVNWTSTTETEATINYNVSPSVTKLYVSVKAKNAAGSWSSVGTSSAISLATLVDSVAAARALDNSGMAIAIENVYVSAVFDNCFYVQDGKHGPGIRCEGVCTFAVGAKVNVSGVLGKNAAGERVLSGASVNAAQ